MVVRLATARAGERRAQARDFDAALGAPGTVAMLVGSSVAFTPDGESLVLLCGRCEDGNTSLFVRRLDELDGDGNYRER